MSIKPLITKFLAIDSDGSRLLRRRRFEICLSLIDHVLKHRPCCRILDIGGEPKYWADIAELIGPRSLYVTLLNQTKLNVEWPNFTTIVGDARDLSGLTSMSFDIAHSNSVIEHVGCWDDMTAMANEIRRIAPLYFVQTPNFWFPVEPHCSTLFFHWVPVPVRVSILMRHPRGNWGQAPDLPTAMRQIQSNHLLDRRMLAALFPDARIQGERFFGITKSWMAVRSTPPLL
jgi:hypothetical protein